MFSKMAASEMFSMNPAPKTGVGMRKMMLSSERISAKSGWAMEQVCSAPVGPGTFVASTRPVMVNRSCTPPSGRLVSCPLETKLTKRASRTGPLGATK